MDELIKRLRYCRDNAAVITDDELMAIADQAADVIEGLLAERDEVNADSWKTAFEVERDEHCWIPVTERLPKAERKSYWVCTDTGYQCECRWTNNKFGIGETDEWDWSIFDIPQYQKVVAWMPLPCPYETPKEE